MAKKFKFKLESVLKFRADKVNQAKDSLNQAIKLRIEKQNAIDATRDKINDMLTQGKAKVKARDLQAKENHINSLYDEILRLEEEKKQIVEIENIRRIKLTNAMKDEKVIDKLKEKQKQEHVIEQNLEESKMLDELGLRITMNNKDRDY